MVFWFTGLSGSGKTTYASFLTNYLRNNNKSVLMLDGDQVRNNLCKDLGFGMEDRKENVRRIASCAALAEHSGIIVCVASIAPLENFRHMARKIIACYKEIYLHCSIQICSKRDPKGFYKRVQYGELTGYTGITSPYEIPKFPDLILDTENESLENSYSKLLNFVSHFII